MIRWLPLLLVGCSSLPKVDGPIPQAEFVDTIVHPWCELLRDCSRGEFDASYDDREECRIGEAGFWDDVLEDFADLGCSYDEAGGQAFYELFSEMECGDFYLGTFVDDYDVLFSCSG